MSSRIDRIAECEVAIEVSDDAPADWLTRVEGDDFPYRGMSQEDGINMLASCCIRLGVEDASRLDGWGDLESGMVTMRVGEHSVVIQ